MAKNKAKQSSKRNASSVKTNPGTVAKPVNEEKTENITKDAEENKIIAETKEDEKESKENSNSESKENTDLKAEENKSPENSMEKKDKKITRECVIKRETKETNITLGLRINGDGNADISTGIGFFDHMLEGFARHGNFDLKIIEKGDLNVDCHHTVEDLGIVLGQAIAKTMEDKTGINRYATFIQPMDDALVLVSVDLCSRAYLNFNYEFTKERVGYFETETLKEFFRAVSDNAGMNIHIKVLDGENTHHIIEATFKAFANALKIACSDSGRCGVLSTKGTL